MFLRTNPCGFFWWLPLTLGLGLGSLAGAELLRADSPPAQREAEQHLQAAEKAIQRRNFAAAEKALTKCIQLGLDNAKMRLLAARTARRAGDYPEAEKHLDAYRRWNGDAKAIVLEKALARAQRGELSKVETVVDMLRAPEQFKRILHGDLSETEKDLLFLAELKKQPADAVLILEALARGYLEAYCLRDALRCLNEWLHLQPKDVQALFWRGWVYEHIVIPEQALEQTPKSNWTIMEADAMHVSPIVPDLLEPMSDKTEIVVRGKKQALDEYRQIVKLDPELEAVRFRLAQGSVEMFDPVEARKQLEYLQKRHPKSAAVMLGLARCLNFEGKNEEAAKLLDRLLADNPRSAIALRERGRLLLQEDKSAGAEELLRQAATLAPADDQTLHLFFLCLHKAGKAEEAQRLRSKLESLQDKLRRFAKMLEKIEQSPRDPAPRYEAGIFLIRSDRKTEGERWLYTALLMDPRHRPTHQALADYYQRAGKKELADKHRQQAR